MNSKTAISSVFGRQSSFSDTRACSEAAAFLARLKAETRSEHDAIERVLSLTSDALTLEGYCQRLVSFYGFYEPVELRLQDPLSPSAGLSDGACRSKVAWLAADLKAFGCDARTVALCKELPTLCTSADRFGCSYVLEGATLGGQIISRQLRHVLGITPDHGGRFFHAYGERTSFMWQSFRAALSSFATTADTQQTVIDSALSTFRAMRRWCEGTLG